MNSLYKDAIKIESTSLFSGKMNYEESQEEVARQHPALKAFIEDDDLQYIQLSSTNIGIVKSYTKEFAK